MQEALYDEAAFDDGGFYRRAGAPGRNFRTAAHASPRWAEAILELATRVDRALETPADFTVVDIGAGGGELLQALADQAPPSWHLVGVDVAPRPDGLPARIEWRHRLASGVAGLLLAVEWLDVIPLDIAVMTEDGLRLLEVDPSGNERVGESLPPDAADWAARWWPTPDVGDRCEIGRARDEAWGNAVRHMDSGLAVAIDYGAVPDRDLGGTLTGYRSGRQVLPVPDGSMDLTAHVLFESLEANAPAGDEVRLMTQREALHQLGIGAQRPAYQGNPASYLAGLSAAGEAAELLDPGGLGGFTWLMQSRGLSMPV